MTRDEFENHDCSLGQESGCTCTSVKVEEDEEDWEAFKMEQNASDYEEGDEFFI